MQISLIISIINLIAIVILFIIVLTKIKNENFTGAPSGYTNLLVTDLDGNLDTFSMDTLKTDMQTMINDSLKPYETSSNISKSFATIADVSQLKTALSGYQPIGSYVKIGDKISLQSERDDLYLYAEGKNSIQRQPCNTDPSKWPPTNCLWQISGPVKLT